MLVLSCFLTMAKAMIAQPTGDLHQHFCMHVLQGALLMLFTALAELSVQLSPTAIAMLSRQVILCHNITC